MRDEKQRFSLRKLSVGLTSVLIGIAFFEAGPKSSTVKADTIIENQSTQVVQTKANADTLNSKTSLNIGKSDTQVDSKVDAKVVTPANTSVDTQAAVQTGANFTSSNATPVASHNKQIGTQNAVKVSQQVAPQTNATSQDTQTAKQGAETTTTTLYLNELTPAFSSNQLNENKVQSQVDDISKISDPSQISANHFAPGTRWTPAGWTRTDKGTKVATSSKLDMHWKYLQYIDSNTGEYIAHQFDDTDVLPGKLTFSINKDDMVKGNQILVATIQQAPANDVQSTDSNKTPVIFLDVFGDSYNVLAPSTNKVVGVLTPEKHDESEIDIWFTPTDTIKNLATDPTFSYDFGNRYTLVNTNDDSGYRYDKMYSYKNHVQYPLYYSVVSNSNILNYKIDFQKDVFHKLSDDEINSVDYNWYINRSWFGQTITNNKNQIDPQNHQTGFVFKLNTLHGQTPSINLVQTIQQFNAIDANGNLTSERLGWIADDHPINKLANNLSSIDLWNATGDGNAAYSVQSDGSILACTRIHQRQLDPTNDLRYITNGSYSANVIDPDHAEQTINNTVNMTKQWSQSTILFNIGQPPHNQAINITDVTPSTTGEHNMGTHLYTSEFTDGNAEANFEMYKTTPVQYLDDDKDEAQVSLDSLIGRQNKESTYTVNVPKGYYVNANNHDDGYKWSADKKTISYTFDPDETKNQNHPIVIHLSHVKQTVNGDTSTQDTQLTTTHTRTIHFVYSDGSKASDDVAQTVIFTRTATRDMTDGALSNFGEWTAHGDYSQVNVPVIHGYTPTQKIVAEANADPNHDFSVTVTYSKNVQQITVSYIDDTTGKTLETKTLDGYSGDDTHYSTNESIEGYKQLGYELVSDSSKGADLVLDSDDFVNNQAETVHLKHGLTTTNLEHDITRTIHYVYSDGHTAKPDSVLSLKFTGTETRDNVTKQITETKWNKGSQNFPEIASPLIQGYTANQTLISDMAVTPNSDNIVQTVTYNPNKQNIHVTFIDDTTGNTLNTVEKSGYTGDDSSYSTKNAIDSLIAKGYKLVSDDSPKDHPTLHFDSDDFTDDQNFTVHMSHDTKESNLNREVTRVIHYVYRDGKPAEQDKTDSINFTGVQKIDKVDGHVISTTWTPENKEFASVNTPVLAGYTPDKFNVDSTVVKPDSDNQVVTITYSPDTQYAKFNYIDDSTGNTLKQETIHGVTGGRDNYSTADLISYYKNKGFDLVSDDTQGKTLTFDSDDNTDQVYAIHFTHGTITIDPQNPGKPGQKLNPNDPSSPVYPVGSDTLTKDVNREIDYIYSDGRTAQPSIKDLITFNNTQKLDKVTGEIISSTWDGPKDFAEIQTPVVEGYTPDKTSVENKGIKHDASPIKVIVTYTADPQHMTVIYRDLTDNRILSRFAKDGISDEDAHYTTKTAIDGYLTDGYLLSNDDTQGTDLVFDHNDKQDQTYYVDFTHGSHPYNPEKPNTKDKVNSNDYLADYNTVISYVDSNGQTLSPNKTVQDEYKRDLTIDSVNGNIINRGEWKLNKGYVSVENPVTTGYITSAKFIKPIDMQKNQTINVVYQKLGQVHLVDNNGKEISKPFAYTNDPHDPTKVLVTKIPIVNGYEQVTTSVDPTKDPTKDTTVVFNAPSTVTVNYVDSNTGKTVHTDTVKGFATHSSDYSTKIEIQNLVDKGYVLTKDNVPTSIKLTEGDTTYLVSFVHGITSVKHEKPVKGGTVIPNTKVNMPNGVDIDDLNRSIVRIITVTDPHTGDKVTTQMTKLYRDATVDNVTGVITYTNWSKGNWNEFTTPAVAGYTPSQNNVPAAIVTSETKDSSTKITYTANPQTGKISYVDDSGHEVSNTLLQGKTDGTIVVTPNLPHGWILVDGQDIPKSVVATPNGIPMVVIKIKHGATLVTPDKPNNPIDKMPDGDNYPDGVTQADLNRAITRTINVVDPHMGLHTTTQTAHLTRNAVVDLVTTAITYGKWSTTIWDEFNAPMVAGYTTSINSVAKMTVDISTKDVTVDITYTANMQKGKISYVDTDGKEISTTNLAGKTDSNVAVKPVIPHGWVIANGQDIPSTVKAGPDGVPTVSIKIKHGEITVTPDKPKTPNDKMPDGDNYPKGVSESDLNRNVTRQIILHMPTGDKQVNQVAKYTRAAMIDLVTGKVTYSDWSTKHGWDEFDVPSATGYTPNVAKVAGVEKPDKDAKVEITYAAIPSSDDWGGQPVVPSTPTTPNNSSTPNVPNNLSTPENSKKSAKPSNKKKQVAGKTVKKLVKKTGKTSTRSVASDNRIAIGAKIANIGYTANKVNASDNNINANVISNNSAISDNIAGSNVANSGANVNTANSANELPQTGSENDKTTALTGILLASMGIATAIGVSRKKRRN